MLLQHHENNFFDANALLKQYEQLKKPTIQQEHRLSGNHIFKNPVLNTRHQAILQDRPVKKLGFSVLRDSIPGCHMLIMDYRLNCLEKDAKEEVILATLLSSKDEIIRACSIFIL